MEAAVAVEGVGGLAEEDVPVRCEKRNRRGSGASTLGGRGCGDFVPEGVKPVVAVVSY